MSTPGSAIAGLDELKTHVGRRETATDIVTAAPANLLKLTFGRTEADFQPGDPLPPGWQCLYFLPRFAPDALRPDGSPLDTGVIPPMPLPRRMFAGERFRFHRPLRIGETARVPGDDATELVGLGEDAGLIDLRRIRQDPFATATCLVVVPAPDQDRHTVDLDHQARR